MNTNETIKGWPSMAIEVVSSLGKLDIISWSSRVTFLLYSLKKHTKKSPMKSKYIIIIYNKKKNILIYISYSLYSFEINLFTIHFNLYYL